MPYLQNETVGWLQFKHKKGKGGYLLISHSASSQKAQYWYGSSAAGLKELCLPVPFPPPPFFFVFHISLDASYHFEKLLRFLFLSYFIISLGYCQVDIKA